MNDKETHKRIWISEPNKSDNRQWSSIKFSSDDVQYIRADFVRELIDNLIIMVANEQ